MSNFSKRLENVPGVIVIYSAKVFAKTEKSFRSLRRKLNKLGYSVTQSKSLRGKVIPNNYFASLNEKTSKELENVSVVAPLSLQ